jgi:transcriptional regulator with XRE-family HTH domain
MPETVTDRVRQITEAAPMSKSAFAEQIRLTPDKLSKSLSGVRRFTSLELALIAEVGGVTVDWLLTGREPLRPAVAARALAADASLEPVYPAAAAEPVSRAYEVLELLGRTPPLPVLPALPETDRYVDQGEALADAALAALREAGVVSVSALDFDELIAAFERVFGVDIAISPLPERLSGLAWQTDSFRLVLVAPAEEWTRQRFTLAHELCHILARDAQELIPEGRVAPGRQKDWTEVRANAFAAGLLMPALEIREAIATARAAGNGMDLRDRALAEAVVRFKVSPAALAVRLAKLRLIDGTSHQRLRGLTTELCHFLAGAMEGYQRQRSLASNGRRVPPRPAAALFSAYRDGETTLRPLASLLGESVEEMHNLLDRAAPQPPVLDAVEDEGEDPVYQP